MTPTEVIALYNRMVAQMTEQSKTRHAYLRHSANRRKQAELFLRWCEQQNYDPGPFMAAAFGSHNWCYRPRLERLTTNKRYVGAYQGEERNYWELFASPALAGPHPGWEIVRKRFRHECKYALCRVQPELTGGYEASSEVCPTCPEMEKCKGDL